ncbi:uncharacterized protein LOC123322908 [Coccinella septempunctata]|uniref:uncharacterized protein LOC123322908 n=1 Tax=Coccinella septempunctata TaxID=41139 RepID=UPI001D080B28|nr:uncharacterized protein LOC123322908 [Coccinella septempunctata]
MVMDAVIRFVLCGLNFLVPFIHVYVDDIIMCIPRDKVDETLNLFNSFHDRLKFTFELEVDNRIPFLDVWLIRHNNRIITDLYSKPTSSGRLMNYQSMHPRSQKTAIVKSIKHRILNLSDPSFHEKNFKSQSNILQQNGYPRRLVNRIFFSSSNSTVTQVNGASSSSVPTWSRLLYIPGLYQDLVRVMRPYCSNISPYCYNTLNRIFTKLKDPVIKEKKSGLIYKINCGDCDKVYVGQTTQYLKSRVDQHRRDCLRSKESTALSAHARMCEHNFDFDNVEILDFEKNWFRRNFKEMLYIKRTPNTVNYRTDLGGLNSTYLNLINRIRTRP